MLEVLASRKVNRGAARRTDPVRADAEYHRRAVLRFGDGNKRYQRMHLADLWIVFDPNVKTRMQTVDQGRTHGGPIDLAVEQPDPCSKFFRVIGRPPDSLTFARSDRSGRNERGIFRLWLCGLCDLCRFADLWHEDLVEFFP